MKNKPSKIVRAFTIITGLPGAIPFFKTKKYYQSENSPRKLPKPCILVSNHISLVDFVLYLFAFPFDDIRFLMAEVLFTRAKPLSWLLYKLGAIYVNRTGYDFSFVGEALETLDGGGMVGIFPEGQLPVNGVPFPFKPSATFIALKTDAPIVPVFTDGTYSFLKRTRMIIGDPIYLRDYAKSENPDDKELNELTLLLHDKIYALGDELEKRKNDERKGKKG